MSGFTPRITITTPQIREWFGTSGNDPGLPNNQTGLLTTQDIAYGYEGDDTVDVGFSAVSQVYGGQGNDSLIGSPVFLSITNLFGDRGNDTIIMKGGTASFGSGGQGNDVLIGSEGSSIDSLFGGQDNDVIRGYSGSDFLSGDAGADIIWGDESLSGDTGNADMILGGTGSDSIVGGGGNDTIYGGQDNDYLEVDASLVRSGTPPVDRFPAGDAGVVSGNDRVFGDLGNDTIGRLGTVDANGLGSTGTDWYDGGEGNDSIQGGNNGGTAGTAATAGTVLAGDTLIGGNGNDTIIGGTDHSGADSIVGGDGDDQLFGGNEASNSPLLRGDTISGGAGNDNIDAQDGNDSVSGGIGADTILGAGGNDTLLGDDQNDSIQGGAGNDSILGGAAQDKIEGGKGSDTLIGSTADLAKGDGVDEFLFSVADITTPGTFAATAGSNLTALTGEGIPLGLDQTQADYIYGFDVAQDKIVITGTTVSGITATLAAAPAPPAPPLANQTIKFGKGFTAGEALSIAANSNDLSPIGQVYASITASAGNTLLYIERDGSEGYTAGTGAAGGTATAGDIAIATLVGYTDIAALASNSSIQII
jgi:Ca2+-binding RTX toxin-like protein